MHLALAIEAAPPIDESMRQRYPPQPAGGLRQHVPARAPTRGAHLEATALRRRLPAVVDTVSQFGRYSMRTVEALVVLGDGPTISLGEIEHALAEQSREPLPTLDQEPTLREAREQFERDYLRQQLILCDGKVGRLAKRVGMERTHLYRKLRSLGIDLRQSTSDD